MATESRDPVALRLRKTLYKCVQDAFIAANVSTYDWPDTYEEGDAADAVTAEEFVAERLGALRRGVEQQRREAEEDIDRFMIRGSEVMNTLVERVGGADSEAVPNKDNYDRWLGSRWKKIDGGIHKLHKLTNDAINTRKRTTLAVDRVFHDLFDENNFEKPEWKYSAAADKVVKSVSEDIAAANEAIEFFGTLPTRLRLGINNHNDKVSELEKEVVRLRLDRESIVSRSTKFVRSMYATSGKKVSHWSPPHQDDHAPLFNSWLEAQKYQICNNNVDQLMGLVDGIKEMAGSAHRCAGLPAPFNIFPDIHFRSSKNELTRWRRSFENGFKHEYAKTQLATREADADGLHFKYGKLLKWMGGRVFDRMSRLHSLLHKGEKLDMFLFDTSYSSYQASVNNATTMEDWLIAAGDHIEDTIRARAECAMSLMDELKQLCAETPDAKLRVKVERVIDMAKDAVSTHGETIPQRRATFSQLVKDMFRPKANI